jgi:peptide/nickel transport system permease protein
VQTAQLNLGRSYTTNEPVLDEILERAWPTIFLVGISTLLSTVIGVFVGIVAGWRRGSKTDYASTTFTMATYSMPEFWLGMLLLTTFAVLLGWLPVGGLESPGTGGGLERVLDQGRHLILPAVTLTLAYIGEYAIVMRSSLLETMREDYLQLARAKGLRDVAVRNRHAVPNALLPVVTLIAINFGFVLSGAIAVETIFSWPGLGLATFNALSGPDLPMLQGLFLVFSAAVIFMNLVADLLYVKLDPRVRTA